MTGACFYEEILWWNDIGAAITIDGYCNVLSAQKYDFGRIMRPMQYI